MANDWRINEAIIYHSKDKNDPQSWTLIGWLLDMTILPQLSFGYLKTRNSSFSGVTTRINKRTGKGDVNANASQTASFVTDMSNPIPTCVANKSDVTKSMPYTSVYTNPKGASAFQSTSSTQHDIIFELFGVWLELSEEKRQEVSDTFYAIFRAFKAENLDDAVGASTKELPRVISNFRPLLADPVFDGVNISIPHKVVEKAKHGLKRIRMNNKGFFFFKFDSRAGLEAVLEGGPWMILFEEDGISLIATFIGKPIMLDSYTNSMCNDSWGRNSFSRCLIEVNSEVDLVDVVTIGVPSLTGDDFTKETICAEYEWRPPRCDLCKIFGHVHNDCPKGCKKKKRKGKSKYTNGGQFAGPSVKPNVRYEPKAITSAPKKGATNVEEDVENVYDEMANLFPYIKIGESSSFTAAAG
ncbi:zinc knuckle CX2CX4HX4C containing protein [Tanacetum coccineum]